MESYKKPRLPKAALKWTLIDWFYELGGWFILAVLWTYNFVSYSSLPSEVPTHFSLSGVADGFSSKSHIFILPIIVTVLYTFVSILNKFPYLYKYNVTITPLNAKRNYKATTRRVRILKFILVVLFGFFWYKSIKIGLAQSEGLGKWFFPLALIVFLFATIIILTGSIRQMHSGENS